MSQGICGRPAVLMVLCFLGSFPPAFAMDSQAGGTDGTLLETGGFSPDWGVEAAPCPTRFDYVVLASFADASNLLSLSAYHFRSEVSFSSTPVTGWQRVDFKVVEPADGDCRSRSVSPRQQTG
jgi:hypothetical protein